MWTIARQAGTALQLALPGQCAVCHGWGRSRVCSSCRAAYARAQQRCRRCALPLPTDREFCGACLRDPPPFDDAVAAVDYAYPWDRLLARFKFKGELDLGSALSDLLRNALDRTTAPDLVLPMPLASHRLRERGFNQAWEVARRLPHKARADVLLRVKDTPHQLSLPQSRRAANVRHAFALEPRHATLIRDADIALVDDVLTTGSTAAEAARALRNAGARRIRIWVVARTPAPAGA